MTNREKRTLSGPLLEVDIYPVWSDGRRVPTREPKTKKSSEAQQKYNKTQAMLKVVRLVNANFDRTDYWMHQTYIPEYAPADAAQAKKDMTNYIRRVRARREKALAECCEKLRDALAALEQMPDNAFLQDAVKQLKKKRKKLKRPLKYIYVIERQVYKTGKYAGLVNWHFHLFISGGLDDKTMEELWPAGIGANCDNFQPDRFGPEAAAKYMSKDPQGNRRFGCSRNLTRPAAKTRDGRYTRRQVEKIATQRVDEASWWEKKYPGYRFLRTFCRWNEYNSNWYVTAVMYRTDADPPASWGEDWGIFYDVA